MSSLRYKEFEPLSRAELEDALSSGDRERIRGALYSASQYEPDWKWAQTQSLKFLDHEDELVRWAAALSLGFIALYQRRLDLDLVLPALHDARVAHPEIRGPIDDALDLIQQHIPRQ
jgi:hypothetical protein